MNRKDLSLFIFFCIVFTLTILLFSYQATLFFFPLTAAQQNTIHFLQGTEELQVNYAPEELSHLGDVASLMKWLRYTFCITVILSTAIILYYLQDKVRLVSLLKTGAISLLTVIVLIFSSSLINFNTLFILFHRLFFPQGNWQFSATAALIHTFPESFFITFSKFMFLPAFVIGAVVLLVIFFLKK